MTDAILRLIRPEVKPATPDEARMEILVYRVRQLGDRVRELDSWRLGYRLRTGRAA